MPLTGVAHQPKDGDGPIKAAPPQSPQAVSVSPPPATGPPFPHTAQPGPHTPPHDSAFDPWLAPDQSISRRRTESKADQEGVIINGHLASYPSPPAYSSLNGYTSSSLPPELLPNGDGGADGTLLRPLIDSRAPSAAQEVSPERDTVSSASSIVGPDSKRRGTASRSRRTLPSVTPYPSRRPAPSSSAPDPRGTHGLSEFVPPKLGFQPQTTHATVPLRLQGSDLSATSTAESGGIRQTTDGPGGYVQRATDAPNPRFGDSLSPAGSIRRHPSSASSRGLEKQQKKKPLDRVEWSIPPGWKVFKQEPELPSNTKATIYILMSDGSHQELLGFSGQKLQELKTVLKSMPDTDQNIGEAIFNRTLAELLEKQPCAHLPIIHLVARTMEPRPIIHMEYFQFDLKGYLRQVGIIGIDEIYGILHHLGIGLKYLHAQNFVHRDLKPGNSTLPFTNTKGLISVFISLRKCSCGECSGLKWPNCRAVIGDFGLSKPVVDKDRSSNQAGTRSYYAPELLLESQEYSKKTDMWGLGCVLVELASTATRGPIFPSEKHIVQYKDGDTNLDLKKEDNPSLSYTDRTNLNSLLHSLLKSNPDERLSIDDFLLKLIGLMRERNNIHVQ